MPVYLETEGLRRDWPFAGPAKPALSRLGLFQERPSQCLRIGLVNNMPDAALEATERQFVSLLDAASKDSSILLSRFAMPGVLRKGAAHSYVQQTYAGLDTLWNDPDAYLDGLIVTGAEPLTRSLADETYWEAFTRLLAWAEEKTRSTIWSCLAAHAAVLASDGISRVRSGEKYFGVYACVQADQHALLSGLPAVFSTPHSRWHGIREEDLVESGYQILSRTRNAGVDTFIKQRKSLFLFFQGHPEYEADSLLREYRRDAARHAQGETAARTRQPRDYFDQQTARALHALEQESEQASAGTLFTQTADILKGAEIAYSWQHTACALYRNWLRYLLDRQVPGRHQGNESGLLRTP